MRKRYAVAAIVCVAALFGTATVFGLPLGDGEVPGTGRDGQADVRLHVRAFRIDGDAIRPLSPGRFAPVNVRITNRHDSRLGITRLRMRLRAVDAPNEDRRRPCSLRDFAVRQARPGFAVTVPAHASRSLRAVGVPRWSWPRVRMVNRPVNQDGCRGASLTLAFRGSGSLRR